MLLAKMVNQTVSSLRQAIKVDTGNRASVLSYSITHNFPLDTGLCRVCVSRIQMQLQLNVYMEEIKLTVNWKYHLPYPLVPELRVTELGENPRGQGENVQTPPRKVPTVAPN